MVGDDTNVSFSNTVLPMGTNTTESVMLTACFDTFAKISRSKDAIVRTDVFYPDIVMFCKVFKSFFGSKHLFGGSSFLKMSVEKLAVMVHPKSAMFVVAIGDLTSLKRKCPPMPETI